MLLLLQMNFKDKILQLLWDIGKYELLPLSHDTYLYWDIFYSTYNETEVIINN